MRDEVLHFGAALCPVALRAAPSPAEGSADPCTCWQDGNWEKPPLTPLQCCFVTLQPTGAAARCHRPQHSIRCPFIPPGTSPLHTEPIGHWGGGGTAAPRPPSALMQGMLWGWSMEGSWCCCPGGPTAFWGARPTAEHRFLFHPRGLSSSRFHLESFRSHTQHQRRQTGKAGGAARPWGGLWGSWAASCFSAGREGPCIFAAPSWDGCCIP